MSRTQTTRNGVLSLQAILCLATLLVIAPHGITQSLEGQSHDETPIELSGFSISESFEIPDKQLLNLDAPIVKKLLYRIKGTSPQSRKEYSRFSVDLEWDDIVQKTEDYRLWVFDRTATLTRIERHRFNNLSPDEEIKSVFVCHCQTKEKNDSGATKFITLARTMPSSLKLNVTLNQPVRMTGFLLSTVSDMDEKSAPLPVFVADRLAWYPNRVSAVVNAAHVRLARHGVDIGLIDHIRQNNTKRLGNKDAEAFFQFISAVENMDVAVENASNVKLGFAKLMRNANSNFGHYARVHGVVRTCSVIPIQHADIRERLGINKYYQLMLFPDLDGAKVVIENKDGKQLDYRKFPVTICCTELPSGLKPQDMERKQFEIEGYFFRFWKYQSDKTDAANATGQVSPLIITKSATPIESKGNQLNFILTFFVISLIVGTAILLWVYRVADKRRKTPGAEILSSLPERISLTGIEE